MKNIKQFFTYLVVGALVMALSISCITDDGPTETGSTTQYHPSQGSYTDTSYNTSATVTVNDNGTCSIRGIARYDETDYEDFDITITTWYYSFFYRVDDREAGRYDGSSYEQSEATINLPSGVDFQVRYELDSGTGILSIWFVTEDITYNTYSLNQQ